MQQQNLDKKFVDWFYHEIYAQPHYNRNGWMREYTRLDDHEQRDWWMRQAFKAGYNQHCKDEAQQLDSWLTEREQVI